MGPCCGQCWDEEDWLAGPPAATENSNGLGRRKPGWRVPPAAASHTRPARTRPSTTTAGRCCAAASIESEAAGPRPRPVRSPVCEYGQLCCRPTPAVHRHQPATDALSSAAAEGADSTAGADQQTPPPRPQQHPRRPCAAPCNRRLCWPCCCIIAISSRSRVRMLRVSSAYFSPLFFFPLSRAPISRRSSERARTAMKRTCALCTPHTCCRPNLIAPFLLLAADGRTDSLPPSSLSAAGPPSPRAREGSG